ncbi:hypothetical protein SUGI_0339360 [Cryptomeria japonica]|nr:hypothetical protein SUGI_0339360 [Cryptomeria japonica]
MPDKLRIVLEREQSSSIVGMMKVAQKNQRIEEDVSKFTSITSSSSFPKATGASKESGTLNSFWKPVEKQQVDDAFVDLFYTSAIPFNVARNPLYRDAIQKAAEFGKGYTPPGSKALRTTLLERQHATRELLRPCDTRFTSFYITLKRVVEEKTALGSMICSNEWESSTLSKSAKGKNIEHIILNSSFWESGAKVLNICGPIVGVLHHVLHMVDSDTPCLGMLYESMDPCKESVQRALNNVEADYMEIWEIVDARWKMMHTPLHATACYLEPKLFCIDRQADFEIMSGLYEAISKSANDSTSSSQQQISKDIATGVEDEPDFLDEELGSDTNYDATRAQSRTLDDFELF